MVQEDGWEVKLWINTPYYQVDYFFWGGRTILVT